MERLLDGPETWENILKTKSMKKKDNLKELIAITDKLITIKSFYLLQDDVRVDNEIRKELITIINRLLSLLQKRKRIILDY